MKEVLPVDYIVQERLYADDKDRKFVGAMPTILTYEMASTLKTILEQHGIEHVRIREWEFNPGHFFIDVYAPGNKSALLNWIINMDLKYSEQDDFLIIAG
jgi:hypothetical protein